MAPRQFRLIKTDGQEIPLTGQFTIGRSPECSLQVEDGLVSRKHALLEVVDQRVILRDLESHNGTWVNNQKIGGPVELREGDQLRLGTTILTLRITVPAPEMPAVPVPPVPQANETMAWKISVPLSLVRGDGAEFGLNHTVHIGRGEGNEIVLKGDNSASQLHAIIELVNGQVLLTDQGSNNGTWVNGRRIAAQTSLRHGDKIRTGNTLFRLRVGERPLPPLDAAAQTARSSRWPACLAVVISLMAVGLVVLGIGVPLAIKAFSPPPRTATPAPTETVIVDPTPAVLVDAAHVAGKQNALRSVVYVWMPIYNGDIKNWAGLSFGSGSMISSQGYVLTNFHVIGYTAQTELDPGKQVGDLKNDDQWILIGLNPTRPEAEPDTFYRAEVVDSNAELDLAVLHITGRASETPFQFYEVALDGGRPSLVITRPLSEMTFESLSSAEMDFPFVPVHADKLEIDDPITIVGYPGVGGNTPTLTEGIVSGFLFLPDQRPEWIKTNAEISEGNSGGMAINRNGELVGVPTWGSFTPTGGRINYIRPIGLALPLIKDYLP